MVTMKIVSNMQRAALWGVVWGAMVLGLGGGAAWAQAGPRDDLERAMAAWDDLREQHIEVRTIDGLDATAGGDGRAQVEARLRTLLTKRRSNREWYDYWQDEGRVAAAVREAQDALVASGGASEEERARFAARSAGLAAWEALAADKLRNQDKYFEADHGRLGGGGGAAAGVQRGRGGGGRAPVEAGVRGAAGTGGDGARAAAGVRACDGGRAAGARGADRADGGDAAAD
jgi:hypothetical protein